MDTFEEQWSVFRKALAEWNKKLLSEIRGAVADMDGNLASVKSVYEGAGQWKPEESSVAAFSQIYRLAAPFLLEGPLRRLDREHPQERVLRAIEAYLAGWQQLTRMLPVKQEVSGAELLKVLRPETRRALRYVWIGRQRKKRSRSMRQLARAAITREVVKWTLSEGHILLRFAQQHAALADPWQDFREQCLSKLGGGAFDDKQFAKDRARWIALNERRSAELAKHIHRLEQQVARLLPAVADELLRNRSPSKSKIAAGGQLQTAARTYWARQRQAIVAHLTLEQGMANAARAAIQQTEATLESLDGERTALTEELREAAAALSQVDDPQSCKFPPPKTSMVSAEDRAREWRVTVGRIGREMLPEDVETIAPRRPLPGSFSPWGRIQPVASFRSAIARAAEGGATRGLREAEALHREMLGEIERAREVVTYSISLLDEADDTGGSAAREGIANAVALIEHQLAHAAESRPFAECGLVDALAAAMSEFHAEIERGRLGLIEMLVRHGGRRSWREASTMGVQWLLRGTAGIGIAAKRAYNWSLITIGWRRAPEQRENRVHRSPFLALAAQVDVNSNRLPMIYRRLFRSEPLEDPRFLVGRESEVTALSEACQFWIEGRSVSIVIAGERGSGKTSLINCALSRAFEGQPSIRLQIPQKLRTRDELYAFLRAELGLAPDQKVRPALKAERRVVVLEEVERTFLRAVNGFEAVRELLSVISDTTPECLWILSLNRAAYRLLVPAVGLETYFSHRIRAMSVDQAELKQAILLRHNLSGLRLSFAAPPARYAAIEPLRRSLGLRSDPQDAFFEALYRQADGIFRAAFDIWHRQIEGVDAGVVRLKFPAAVDLGPMLQNLTEDDLFTLQAVMQHGSLTDEEHSIIFGLDQNVSRARFDRLEDRELLEPDPGASGFRVRPNAGYLVRRALDAENLL